MILGMLEQRIQQHFFDGADLLYQAADTLARPVAAAAQTLLLSLTGGGKLLLTGTGASLAIAQAMGAQLVGRFERDRPALAALVLGADAVASAALLKGAPPGSPLALQVQALGTPGDVLVVFAASAHDGALAEAVAAAQARDMSVVALTPRSSALGALLGETDVWIAVPHERAARVHEVQLLVAHALCDALDLQLMGEQDHA